MADSTTDDNQAVLTAIMQGDDARSPVDEVAERLGVPVIQAQIELDRLVAEDIVSVGDDPNPAPGRERLYWVNQQAGLDEVDRLGM